MNRPRHDFSAPVPAVGVSQGAVPTARLTTPATSGNTFVHPFKIIAGSTAGTVQVIGDSVLLDFFNTGSTIAIDGLDSDLTISEGDKIYLHGIYVDGGFDSAEVVANSDDPDEVVLDYTDPEAPFQTDFWLALGIVTSVPGTTTNLTGLKIAMGGGDDPVWVYQRVFTHVRMTVHCADGDAADFPVPA
mgnify:FL=1